MFPHVLLEQSTSNMRKKNTSQGGPLCVSPQQLCGVGSCSLRLQLTNVGTRIQQRGGRPSFLAVASVRTTRKNRSKGGVQGPYKSPTNVVAKKNRERFRDPQGMKTLERQKRRVIPSLPMSTSSHTAMHASLWRDRDTAKSIHVTR